MKKQLTILLLFLVAAVQAQIFEPVTWKYELKRQSDTEGELLFKATIQEPWHMYGMDLPQGGPVPTTFKFVKLEGAELDGKVNSASKLHEEFDKNFEMKLSWYTKEATFVQKVKIDPTVDFLVEGEINFMCCNDENCLPPTTEEFEFTTPSSSKTVLATANQAKSTVLPVVALATTPLSNTSSELESETTVSTEYNHSSYWTPVIDLYPKLDGASEHHDEESSWWIIFITGMAGGLFALFTPCVWPIIPMTVSFFLKRSGSKGRRDAILYGVSIVVIYLALGLLVTLLFGASALNSLSTNAVFNLIFFALLIVFAISFFGAFDITLPSTWSTAIDSKASKTGGVISIFLMAFTLVLVSFSCTGPIIGTLLVQVSSNGSLVAPAIGMGGFAVALAIPFSLFALFPSMLKKAPKSGGWLNSVKVVLGFLELALALKFLSVADLAYGWRLLDREVFLVLWILIFVMLGLYLMGKIKFSHDSDLKYVSVPRLFLSIFSFSFALYMVPGLWGAPLRAISAFSPPLNTQDFNLYNNEVHAQFDDFEMGMDYAAKVGKPVMVDFSGYGCVNCRKMEASVWIDSQVRKRITEDYVLITLMVDDKTPLKEIITVTENGKERTIRTIGDKWSYLQRVKFGANAQPYYVLLDNQAKPLARPYSFNEDIAQYIQFLDAGLAAYKKKS